MLNVAHHKCELSICMFKMQVAHRSQRWPIAKLLVTTYHRQWTVECNCMRNVISAQPSTEQLCPSCELQTWMERLCVSVSAAAAAGERGGGGDQHEYVEQSRARARSRLLTWPKPSLRLRTGDGSGRAIA